MIFIHIMNMCVKGCDDINTLNHPFWMLWLW